MKLFRGFLIFALVLALFPFAALAGGYFDSSGTSSLPFVPLGGCTVNGNCVGPAGSGSTIYSGQQTLTTSAAALPSHALANGVVITAETTNTGTVYVGPSGVTTSTGYPLVAGQSISYAINNLSSIYIIGTNGTDVVAFTGN